MDLYPIIPFALFIAVYLTFLITSATFIGFSSINSRLVTPVYIPVLLTVLFAIDQLLRIPVPRPSSYLVKTFLVGTMAFWLLTMSVQSIKGIVNSVQNGVGEYSTSKWLDSSLMNYLNEYPLDGAIYSNANDAMYILTGADAKRTPFKYRHASNILDTESLQIFNESIEGEEQVYFVWFDIKSTRGYLYGIEELNSLFNLRVVESFSDGTIYRLK